jgi:23S rRNA (uracil1939-C5)-methyltransferase
METQITIERLVSGGHGLGRINGKVILVPFSAPGDVVTLDEVPARKGVNWGNIKRILSPSPARISPFCPHYTLCGGCQLQHIAYEAQLECKRLMLDDALRRLAGLKDVEVCACVPSPAQTTYRSRARFHCHRDQIGFHKARSNVVHPLESCPLLSDRINACLSRLAAHLSSHPLKGLSEIQMMEDNGGRVVLTLEMDGLPGVKVVDGLREVGAAAAVARAGRRTQQLWGESHCAVSVDGRTFRVSPSSFFQANASLLPGLVQHALAAVRGDAPAMAVELYAGVGLFSIMLSERVKRIMAVEWNRDAAENAAANLTANRIENVETLALSAEDALDSLIAEKAKPELVVMDPPREGLSNSVRSKLLDVSPQQMIYVSCNPATLARDLKSLVSTGRYRLEHVTPLDMFPHTAHIECVCSLERN